MTDPITLPLWSLFVFGGYLSLFIVFSMHYYAMYRQTNRNLESFLTKFARGVVGREKVE